MTKKPKLKAKIICTTCVRDEEQIIGVFLSAASKWADRIILINHASVDNTKKIALKYPKVTVIDYENSDFNEAKRRAIQFEALANITGPKIVFNLDADELLYGYNNNPEWDAMIAEHSDIVTSNTSMSYYLKWPNLLPDLKNWWQRPDAYLRVAYHDHQATYLSENNIHEERVPQTIATKKINTVFVLHTQYLDWAAMQAKQNYYQIYEALNNPHKHPINIFRQYTHMYRDRIKYRQSIPDDIQKFLKTLHLEQLTSTKATQAKWEKKVNSITSTTDVNRLRYVDIPENKNLLLYYLRATKTSQLTITLRIIDKVLKKIYNV